jgi:hypothetical protein
VVVPRVEATEVSDESRGFVLDLLQQIRIIQLELQRFNTVHTFSIFLLKQSLLGCVTIEYFGAIYLYTRGDGFGALIFFVFGVYDTTAFVFMYCKSYTVKSGIARTRKALTKLSYRKILSEQDQVIVFKNAKSIPITLGIKVGSFSTMSESSSTEFLDFVIQQASSLVITYKIS